MTNHAVHLVIPTRSTYGDFEDPAGNSIEFTSFRDKSNVVSK